MYFFTASPVKRQLAKVYDNRTAEDQVNSRLYASFGFEQHYFIGRKKMLFRFILTLLIVLASAIGRVKEKRPDLIRSLVKALLKQNTNFPFERWIDISKKVDDTGFLKVKL